MALTLKRRWPTIEALPRLTRQQQKAVLKIDDPTLTRAICEICHNLLQDRIPLDKKQKRRLSRYKNIFRKLVSERLKLKEKKNILVQRSGFLSLLVPVVASVISGIISASV